MFCIATLFGLSSAVQIVLLMRLNGETIYPIEWLHIPLLNLAYWYMPALLAPLIMRLAVRYRLGHTSWWQQLAVHGAGAITYSIVHTASMIALRTLLTASSSSPMGGGQRPFWVRAGTEYIRQFDWQLMTYLFLVGLAHALAYRRDSERQALEASKLETRLVEARLQSLQRQLHPHFLFNTLNTIAGLIRTNVNAADTMIDQLGDLLRMALHTSNQQEVALTQELDALRKYLDIEQTRLGSRLRVKLHIDPEALDARLPNLLLQPLVENAVRHGVAPFSRPGSISIEARRDHDQLIVHIVDSGYGVPPDRLAALNNGVGLSNTRARLEHLYPGQHTFTFANIADGFRVSVVIPYRPMAAELDTLEVGVA